VKTTAWIGGKMKPGYGLFISAAILLAVALPAWCGPPFLTDDPEPVDTGHFEFYLFQTLDQSGENTQVQAPAVEFNWGALPDLQLHLLSSFTYFSPGGNVSAYGLGDTEAGIKFRFIQEGPDHPQIGIFPAVEIPTGDAARGLGNGVAWVKLPLWIQKSWGPWTTYGGGGYAWNAASGARDYPFGGWLIQRDLGGGLTLGAEIFAQGRDTDSGQGFLLANLGGQFNFSRGFSLLFSGGHSIAGDNHTVIYLGLYWTGGPGEKKDE
jgi:hypothetical protein